MDTVIRVQILDASVCISYRSNTFKKSMNQIILPSTTGK